MPLSIPSARTKPLPRVRMFCPLMFPRPRTLGKTSLRSFASLSSLKFTEGMGERMTPPSLVVTCLCDMTWTWRVPWWTVLKALFLTANFNRDVKCMVCTTCSGLLEKAMLGLYGAWTMYLLRLLTLLNGLISLLNELVPSDYVTVPTAKLWWCRLLLSAFVLIRGPCELRAQDLWWVFMNLILMFPRWSTVALKAPNIEIPVRSLWFSVLVSVTLSFMIIMLTLAEGWCRKRLCMQLFMMKVSMFRLLVRCETCWNTGPASGMWSFYEPPDYCSLC